MVDGAVNRYGTGLDPDPSLSQSDDDPPIASTRYSVTDRPVAVTDNEIRCQGKTQMPNGQVKVCNRLLANLATRPWEIACPRCKTVSQSPDLAAVEPADDPTPSALGS